MRIAVLGSGGREHAMAWKLQQEPGVEHVLVAPGNGGTRNNVALDVMDFATVRSMCWEHKIDLLMVGPEAPLASGIVDALADEKVRVFGPNQQCARLEGSKVYAKGFMDRHGVATAQSRCFRSAAEASLELPDYPGGLVLKYDGLAGGKGVYVCSGPAEGQGALLDIARRYGDNAPIVVEERLHGSEISVLGVTDGKDVRLFSSSQDHKQLLDGDRGPNTGGMGAYCPVPAVTDLMLARIQRDIVDPTMAGLQAEGMDYRGVIYFGIMMTSEGPRLLEYNVRLGDPEAEVLLPALSSGLGELALACMEGRLSSQKLEFNPGVFVDVVLASGGYPGEYETGFPIYGLDMLPRDTLVFHAGTQRQAGTDIITTDGGRVLNVVGHGETLGLAIRRAYETVGRIEFEGMTLRTDIGRRVWSL